jgi:acetoacetyl-CoA synthetase
VFPRFNWEAKQLTNSALDAEGETEGVPGELVCRQAFPIEPLGFWPLPGYGFPEIDVKQAQDRFFDSYFKDDKGTWCKCFALFQAD